MLGLGMIVAGIPIFGWDQSCKLKREQRALEEGADLQGPDEKPESRADE
ncbi:MAG: hypothetical protein KDB61_00785 [Planctomycetes bacterium]|nr:hypothetical protein [Planctomycetota bacterium]